MDPVRVMSKDDDFFEPDEPVEDVQAAFDNATRRGVTRVPTNAELAERVKDKELVELVREWLRRHVVRGQLEQDDPDAANSWGRWLDWAANNFVADPEIAASLTISHQREYQRGYEDGRRAEGDLGSAITRDVALNLLRVGRLNELDAYLRGVIPAPDLGEKHR